MSVGVRWHIAAPANDRKGVRVRRLAYSEWMVSVEFSGSVYTLTDDQGKLLAENLRNYAKGTFPADVKRVTELSGNPNWTDGALAAADFIEEILVGNLDAPLPLEGKAAEATFWTLRMMQGLLGSTDPTDMAALRDALAKQFARQDRREAA
jgi:hypothetical protein